MDTEYRETRRGDIRTIQLGDIWGQRNDKTGRHAHAYIMRDGRHMAAWGPVYYGPNESVDYILCPDQETARRIVHEWVAGRQAGATL